MNENTVKKINDVYGNHVLEQFQEQCMGDEHAWIDNHLKTLLNRFERGEDFLSFIQYFIELLKSENRAIVNASFMSSHIKKFNIQLIELNNERESIAKEDEIDELEEDFIQNESLAKQIDEIKESLEYIRNDVQEGFYDVGEIKQDGSMASEEIRMAIKEIKSTRTILESLKSTKSKRPRTAEYQQVQELEKLVKAKNEDSPTEKKERIAIDAQNIHPYIFIGVGLLITILLFLLLLKV